MPLTAGYRGQALPLYGRLIVADPSLSGTDEADFQQCVSDSETAVIGGSGRRVAIKAGQDTVEIAVHLEVWDTMPDVGVESGWEGPRELTVEFPGGRIAVENLTAGLVPLSPGDLEQVPLPGGGGEYRVVAWHRGRDRAAAVVAELEEADDGGDEVAGDYAQFAGLEEYLLRIWPA